MKSIGLRSVGAVTMILLMGSASAAAAAGCLGSVSVLAGQTVEVGRVDGKAFIISSQPAEGRLTTAPQGASNLLLYTANNVASPTSDTVICEIQGSAPAVVQISIQQPAPQLPVPQQVDADAPYGQMAKILALLFALAVILESALAALFRWRPFVEILNPRAVRPLVAVIIAWSFVRYFDLDLVTTLVNAAHLGEPRASNVPGKFLTALVLAGGSAGINSMLVALGVRQVTTPENTQPRPPRDKAWIAVKAHRKAGTVGDIQVLIGPDQSVAGSTEPPLAGIIGGTSRGGLLAYFTRDLGRFPSYGGYEVMAGVQLRVVLRAIGSGGQPVEEVWGPHVPAPGAIIDLNMTI